MDSSIPDFNLRLAILNEVMLTHPDLFPPDHVLIPQVLGRPYDPEEEGYEPLPAMEAYFRDYPLTDSLLGSIHRVVLDGGNGIYFYIWSFWDGTDDRFTVRDLTGIDRCPNLREFIVCSLADPLDLSPLRSIQTLEKVSLDPLPHQSLDALLDLPALARVELFSTDYYKASPAIQELERRGVSLKWFD